MRKSSNNISGVRRVLLIALKQWQKLLRSSFELKISVKSCSCQDRNGEEVVTGNGNKLPAPGKAKHVCFGNPARGLGRVEIKQKEAKKPKF